MAESSGESWPKYVGILVFGGIVLVIALHFLGIIDLSGLGGGGSGGGTVITVPTIGGGGLQPIRPGGGGTGPRRHQYIRRRHRGRGEKWHSPWPSGCRCHRSDVGSEQSLRCRT